MAFRIMLACTLVNVLEETAVFIFRYKMEAAHSSDVITTYDITW